MTDRRHRFADVSKPSPPSDDERYRWKERQHRIDRGAPQPTLRELWAKSNGWERACWVVAVLGAALIAWLVARRVP